MKGTDLRFLAAMMRHETNTFSPVETPLSAFFRGSWNNGPVYGGDAIDAFRNTNYPIAAMIDLCESEGWRLDIPIIANASPSGPVADEAFEHISQTILDALEPGIDGIFLDLHGAMVSECHDDAEGELIRRVRERCPEVPIAVALDFHTNLSAAMIDNSTIVTAYRTYPHTDMYETGERACRTLLRTIRGEVDPVIVWGTRPMLPHMLRQAPSHQPMKDIMDRAIEAEESGEVLNASLLGSFPLADTPHTRFAALIVADRSKVEAGRKLCEELLDLAWKRREDFVFDIEPMEVSLARARELEGGPILLVDHGDNTGAGGCQDNMAVIEAALELGCSDIIAGPIYDPAAVAAMVDVGVGQSIELDVGGKIEMPALRLERHSLRLSGKVTRITDGRFRVTGPMMTGIMIDLGRCAVLDTGPMRLLVCERRLETFDAGCFTHAGLDPSAARFVIIKSRQHFRAGFEDLAKHIVMVAGPGVCSSDYSEFPFRKLTRPIYPLDEISDATANGNESGRFQHDKERIQHEKTV